MAFWLLCVVVLQDGHPHDVATEPEVFCDCVFVRAEVHIADEDTPLIRIVLGSSRPGCCLAILLSLLIFSNCTIRAGQTNLTQTFSERLKIEIFGAVQNLHKSLLLQFCHANDILTLS